MPDLIAQGPQSDQRWRREVPSVLSGITPVVGRTDGDWRIPWDPLVSRRHVRLIPRADDRLEVVVLPEATNPVFYRGIKHSGFTVVPGEHFVIGETTLLLVKRPGAADASNPGEIAEESFDADRLTQRRYRNTDTRIEMLSRLPDLVAGSESDEELLVRVSDLLLRATPDATAVAIVAVRGGDVPGTSAAAVEVLHYDSRSLASEPPPISARLVRTAVSRRESVLHTWPAQRSMTATFTASEEADWAFCVPLRSEACPGWAIYVSGKSPRDEPSDELLQSLPNDATEEGDGDVLPFRAAAPNATRSHELQDDLKFTNLVAATLSSIRQSQQLQQRQTALRQFFAPVVMRALIGRGHRDVLQPREVDLCVMFCDLRGFSRHSERDAERLLDLLARVSDALGVMTHHILDTGGVIGDFHGDAAMGFWGWPLAQADAAVRAADAALRIRAEYASPNNVTQFRCGIGIASGRGVAGQIGTVDQVKVTAFGPVVNLAARLEGLNKPFGTEIIVDAATAGLLQASEASLASTSRLRRLARVRPPGMTSVTEIFELRPRTAEDLERLSDQQIADYERSLKLMFESRWSEAYEWLHRLPASDRPKDVLLSLILKHNRTAPADWNGVIDFPST